MANLKEEPRIVQVVVGQFPNAQLYVMVGYDVVSGDSWGSFPPKDGNFPYLVGDPPAIDSDYRYYCMVEWVTEDGTKHRGKIQVTPVLLPYSWKIEPVMDHE